MSKSDLLARPIYHHNATRSVGLAGEGLVFTTAFGTAMDAPTSGVTFRRALHLVLRHRSGGVDTTRAAAFVRLGVVGRGVPLEEISRLVGHSGTTVTELVYRHQLKPVLQTGATVMNQLFKPRTDRDEPPPLSRG